MAERGTPDAAPSGGFLSDPNRRKFLWLGTGLVVLEKYLPDTGKISTVTQDLFRASRILLDKMGKELEARRKLVRQLLRFSGYVHTIGPKGHPLYHRPGPHDIAAMAVATSLYESPREQSQPPEAILQFTDSLFCPGSPINSRLAATFVPSDGQLTPHDTQLVVNPKCLPYHFIAGSSDDLILKGATTGQVRKAWTHMLKVSRDNEAWRPVNHADQGRLLLTDFLLLTVLPWNRQGGFVVLSGGAHGAGTGAIEFLMRPDGLTLDQLEKLVDDVKEADAFQIVFEVPVTHEGPYTTAVSMRVSGRCPPTPIRNTDLFTASDKQIYQLLSAIVSDLPRDWPKKSDLPVHFKQSHE